MVNLPLFLVFQCLEGYNLLEFSPRVLSVISEIQETMPFGYNIDIATYQADVVAGDN